jgi:hypothetical protein
MRACFSVLDRKHKLIFPVMGLPRNFHEGASQKLKFKLFKNIFQNRCTVVGLFEIVL